MWCDDTWDKSLKFERKSAGSATKQTLVYVCVCVWILFYFFVWCAHGKSQFITHKAWLLLRFNQISGKPSLDKIASPLLCQMSGLQIKGHITTAYKPHIWLIGLGNRQFSLCRNLCARIKAFRRYLLCSVRAAATHTHTHMVPRNTADMIEAHFILGDRIDGAR